MNLSTLLLRSFAAVYLLHSVPVSAKNVTGNNSPLSFIENKGQVTDGRMHSRTDIQYKLDVPGISTFIGNGAIHYQWTKALNKPQSVELEPGWELKRDKTQDFETYRVDVILRNANTDAVIIPDEQQAYYETYYLPYLLTEGTVAHSYNRITYKNIYKNIDWVLYTSNGHLKYDFIVHAGGNIADIQMQYGGAETIRQVNGQLMVTTPFGNITEEKPYAYDAETKQEIPSAFVINNNTVSFNVNNAGNPCVIDPALNWSTYYGGSLDEETSGIIADLYGNAYITGSTISNNNIATSGTFRDTLYGTAYDGFLIKINGDGNRIWGTYFGGPGADYSNAVAYTKNHPPVPDNQVTIVGNTYSSTGIATLGNYNISNKSDAFMMTFYPDGKKIFSRYLGGEGDDVATCINIPAGSQGIVAGYTSSTTLGSSSSVNAGGFDGFYVLGQFSTITYHFLGGPGNDYIQGVAMDPTTNIYFAGSTNSATGIANSNAQQGNLAGGTDGFVTFINKANIPVWSTYYGGSGNESFNCIAFIDNNNIVVGGNTTGSTGLATAGAHQQNNAGSEDGLLAKFNISGQLQWATYLGGTASDNIETVAVDPSKNIYTAGYTYSNTGIATSTALQNILSGNNDYMLATFASSDGTRTWGSYYGGSSDESYKAGIATSLSGLTFFTGSTYSNNLSVANASQPNPGGMQDGFASCMVTDTGMYITEQSVPATICGYSKLNIEIKTSANFNPGNVFYVYIAYSNSQPSLLDSLVSTTGGTVNVTVPNNLNTGYKHIYVISSNPVRTNEFVYPNLSYFETPDLLAPVYTSVYPSDIVGPGALLIFSAVPPPGISGTYQWQKNGIDIPGATGDTLYAVSATDVADGDSIRCIFTTPLGTCNVERDFPSIARYITIDLGVHDVTDNSNVHIYPNPSNGSFTISGLSNVKAESMVITDIMGKTLWSQKVAGDTEHIILPASVPNGIYLVKLMTDNGIVQSKLALKR